MALYRNSRFPKGSFLMVLIVVVVFIVLQLMTSESTSSTESKSTPNNPRVAIVTFTTDEHSYTHLSLKNKNLYARRHGYDLFVDWEANEPRSRGTMWHKFVMLEQVMAEKKHDWIWWIDFDTLITNTTIKLEDIIQESLENSARPNDIDFLFTGDCSQFNAGSMLVRSSPSALAFLNVLRATYDANQCASDQHCITVVVNNNAHGEANQTLWIPQWKINAYPEEIKCRDKADRGWERGLFMMHFAGAWAHVRNEDPVGFLMRKYEGEVIWS